MVAVVGASFRGRPRPTAVSLVPVLLGVTWSLGLWGLLGRPIGLLELAALPILLGLGLDDGVHAVHGTRAHGPSLAAAIGWVGPPIALTSLTTCVGFASLGLSHVPALRSLGLLVALGVTACLVATVAVLPTLDHRGTD
jgi:predicted RND superfamily exporter protein